MEDTVILFKQCPLCGSTMRYIEELVKQEKEAGHLRPEAQFCARVIRDSVVDNEMAKQFPFGTKVPVYEIWEDVCLGYPDKPCGNIYAVKLMTGTATKKPMLVKPFDLPDDFGPRKRN